MSEVLKNSLLSFLNFEIYSDTLNSTRTSSLFTVIPLAPAAVSACEVAVQWDNLLTKVICEMTFLKYQKKAFVLLEITFTFFPTPKIT